MKSYGVDNVEIVEHEMHEVTGVESKTLYFMHGSLYGVSKCGGNDENPLGN